MLNFGAKIQIFSICYEPASFARNIVKMRLLMLFFKHCEVFQVSQLRDHFLGARKIALGSSFPCPGHTLENAFQHAHSKQDLRKNSVFSL